MTTINNLGLETYLDFSLAFSIMSAIVTAVCIAVLIFKEDSKLRALAFMCAIWTGMSWYYGFVPAKDAVSQLLELQKVAEVTNK